MFSSWNLIFPPETIEYIKLALHIVWVSSPAWLFVVTSVALFKAWLDYKRSEVWTKEGSVLLEVKLPREIMKSPLAMEIILGAFYQTGGEATWVNRLWEGKTRPWFSLEIVSLGSNVKFFIWTRPKFRNLLESQLYGQYPGIEIYEAADYSIPLYYNPDKTQVWGCEFALTKEDPYPIKTYIDYGLDKDPKEELKTDPMTAMLEFLGSASAGHNICIQIIIRAHKKEQKKALSWSERFEKLQWSETIDAWKDEAEVQKNKIIKKFKPDDKEKPGRAATKGELDVITALERSVTKLPFDCGIRAIYVADKDKFNPNFNGGITGSFKQYSSQDLNGFKPKGWFGIFDYPWQDYFGSRKEWMKKKLLEEYKLRRFFYSPFMGSNFYSKPFVLNTEELATIYHFPGAVATTPTLERIPSRKSEPPANLPS